MALFHTALTQSSYPESSYSMHYSLFKKKITYKEYYTNNFIRFMKFLLKHHLSISLTSEIGSILHSTPVHQATIIPSSQLYFFFKALIITSIMISKTSVLAFHLQCFLYLNVFRRLLKSVHFQNYIIPLARSLF